MSADPKQPGDPGHGVRQVLKEKLAKVPGLLPLVRMTVETVRVCMHYRVTGLAAEAGYFALLSLPPLIFGLLGGVGYAGDLLGPGTVQHVKNNIQSYASGFLTEQSLHGVLMPTISDAINAGRPDVISVGFLLSLWSGSRCLNVLLDTISIMYSQGGKRGIVRTRMLSLSLYVVSLAFGAIVVPLIVIGPEILTDLLPAPLRFLMTFYWPLVGGLTVLGFATLFYIATPKRTPWVRDLPGAALTLAAWVVTSMVLRWALNRSLVGGLTIYGPLAATIVVLIWLYFLAIGVLIGAALNAATVRLWPPPELAPVRERARALLEDSVSRLRENGDRVGEVRGGDLPGRARPTHEEAEAAADDRPDRTDDDDGNPPSSGAFDDSAPPSRRTRGDDRKMGGAARTIARRAVATRARLDSSRLIG